MLIHASSGFILTTTLSKSVKLTSKSGLTQERSKQYFSKWSQDNLVSTSISTKYYPWISILGEQQYGDIETDQQIVFLENIELRSKLNERVLSNSLRNLVISSKYRSKDLASISESESEQPFDRISNGASCVEVRTPEECKLDIPARNFAWEQSQVKVNCIVLSVWKRLSEITEDEWTHPWK